MKRVLVSAVLLVLVCSSLPVRAATLGSELQHALTTVRDGDSVSVIIHFSDRVDPSAFHGDRARAGALIRSLHDHATRSQARVLAFLAQRGYSGRMRSFWINNSIAVRVPGGQLGDLARFTEVESIDFDEPVLMDGAASSGPPDRANSVQWDMSLIGVDQVWSGYGLDGTGIVVGSMDTGFDPNHPALLGKWRGGTNSWMDCVNGLPNPYDDHGHGTHTIGTMVGGDGAGPDNLDIGIAYKAKFISAKVLDLTNSFSSASTVIAGAQWMLDPDGNPATNDFPDVINNSWIFFSNTYTGFHSTVSTWLAAGIIPVFCIGNQGPGSATTQPPGNYDNTIGVGATDSGDLIASFSSRGPSPNDVGFPPDRRKPDLSAPGVSVLSAYPGGGYVYFSGTSMASPHVAGTVALMLQAHPGMSFDEVRSALITTSVDRGDAGYDYGYGYGRLDAFGAVTVALVPGYHLAGAAAGHDIQLSWNSVPGSDVTGYEIYRSPQIQDLAPELIGSTTDTTFTDPHRSGRYYYRMRQVRDSGLSPYTNEVGITTCGWTAPELHVVGDVGNTPAAGDFNGDGHLDLAVPNTLLSGTITVVAGDGTGQFGAGVAFPAGNQPIGIATGDFNGDGIADLAVTDNSTAGTVSILLGNGTGGIGDGTFAAPVAYAVGQKPIGILAADLNEDGITDLVAVNYESNSVSVLLGNGASGVGDGTFAAAVNYAVGTRPRRIVSGDFNQDGVPDLAVVDNGNGRVSILLGNGSSGRADGTFATTVDYSAGGGAFDLVSGDFNSDGITDVAVTRNLDPGFVVILRGQGSGGVGNGTFASAGAFPAGSFPQGIAAADLNGDGITDLCVASGVAEALVSVLLGTGSGTTGDGGFERPAPVNAGVASTGMMISDLNRDGAPDIIAVSLSSAQNLSVLRGTCGSDVGTALTLLAPNGGESWPGSTEQTIAWSKDPGVLSVDIDASRDGGATWRTIATHQTGTAFVWTVTEPQSAPGSARVRVYDPTGSRADTSDAGFTIAPDIRLGVPGERSAGADFALAPANPSTQGLRVRFTLASREPAALELLDVNGRRVMRRSVEGLGPGEHVLDIGAGLRAGIYLVRLTQGERRLTRKAAVLR